MYLPTNCILCSSPLYECGHITRCDVCNKYSIYINTILVEEEIRLKDCIVYNSFYFINNEFTVDIAFLAPTRHHVITLFRRKDKGLRITSEHEIKKYLALI